MMKWKWTVAIGFISLAALVGAGETPALKTVKDKLSYATGVDLVRSFQRQGVEVDRELFLRGVKDGLSGGKLLMSDDDLNKVLKVFQTEQKMKLSERKRQQAEQLRKQRQGATPVEPGSTVPTATDNQRP